MLEFKVNVDKEISLRMFEIHDANELFELVKSSKDYLCQWLPWAQNYNSVEEAVKFINFTLEEFKKNNEYQLAIIYNGDICGVIRLSIDSVNKSGNLGYWLGFDFQGKGIMTRVVRWITDYAIRVLNLYKIEIHCPAKNKKSRAIPERLGFIVEEIKTKNTLINNEYHDMFVYVIYSNMLYSS